VHAWVTARGETYNVAFLAGSHAHNLYLNTLAERGLAGFALLTALLAAWTWSLLRALPHPRDPPVVWLVWSGAASALAAIAGIGLFNTTLHDEHGVLAMLLLGAWLGRLRSEARIP
jgi:O-antigen ligase